ncbi:hypothetical protein MAR_005466 [Mya arenaria]|uniref:Uncharacterized protein n=1 Tax=Mya arenaria TaxID=6604 RepID=A0ABY7F2T4_MYAAR|nr:hypothetical protein MAR_005466 [Mya arenaria]
MTDICDKKERPNSYMQIKDNDILPTADDQTTSNDNHGEEPQYEIPDPLQAKRIKHRHLERISTDSESAYLIVTDRKNPPSEIGAHSMSMQHPKMDKELTHQQSKIKGGGKIVRPKTDVKMTRPNKTRPQSITNSSSASKTNSENPMIRVDGRDHSSTSKNQGESQSIKMMASAIEQSLKLGISMGKGTPRSHSCAHLQGAHKVSCGYPENPDQETHVQRKIKGGRKIGPSKTDTKTDVKTRYPIGTNSCSALETNSENGTIDYFGKEKHYSTVLKKGESQSMRMRINEFEQSLKPANSFGKELPKNIPSSKLHDLYENVDYPAVKNDKRAGATTK